MKTQPISELLPEAVKVIKYLNTDQSPMLVTQNGKPAAYLVSVTAFNRLQRRMRLLEGIARGEKAIREGRTVTHSEAKKRMRRWLE
jgi:prevent-host-death family protein